MTFTARHARRWLLGLVLIECGLAAVFGISFFLGEPVTVVHRLFDLDGEANLPAWFSSMQLFVIGSLFLLLGRRRGSLQGPSAWLLAVLGASFLFLSADEVSGIHEKIDWFLPRYEWMPRLRGDRGTWMPIYLALGLLFLVTMRRDLLATWRRHRHAAQPMLWGIGLYTFGAFVLDLIYLQFLVGGWPRAALGIEIVVEELSEMVGASLFLYGLMLLGLRLRDRP